MDSRQPTFFTQRLELRPARVDDDVVLHGLWSDPLVRRFLFDDWDVSLELAQSVLADLLSYTPKGQGLWLIHDASSSSFLGCAGISPAMVAAQYEPALRGLLEPMAALAPAHWGKGYAQEALCPILDHAFGALNQSAIAAASDVPNIASERVLLRLGFSPLSETQGPVYRLRTYRLSRGAWNQRKRTVEK